jgi:uncharacterized RDD family membrane protein YckC
VEYEDRLTIATPEGVPLDLTLAGLGSRFMAGGVDLLLKLVLVIALGVGLLGIGELGIAVFVPAMALVLFAYDVLWEVLGQGRTPGKRWVGVRVVRTSGAPVDLRASMVRNVLRLIDGLPLSYLPTIVLIVATPRNQRLGDLAAGTLVIRDRPGEVAPAVNGHAAAVAPDWDVSAVTAEELAAVRGFLARRDGLDAAARTRIAHRLDVALRERVGGATEAEAERFLEGVAAAKLARER